MAENGSITLSRRDFLLTSLATAAGFGLGSLASDTQPKPVTTEYIYVPIESQANFLEVGLGDYINIYNEIKSIKDIYGATLFPEIYDICYTLDSPTEDGRFYLSQERIDFLGEGWVSETETEEETKARAVRKAHEVIESLVFIECTYTDDIEPLLTQLHQVAEVYPLLIILMENHTIGIYSDEQPELLSPFFAGYYNSHHIQFDDPENKFWSTHIAIHEGDHAFHYEWEKIKPFMKKSDFIRLVEAEIYTVRALSEFIFTVPEDEAISLKNGFPAIHYPLGVTEEDAEYSREVLSDWESLFNPQDRIDTEDQVFDTSVRFTQLAHFIGSRLLGISKARNAGTITQEDQDFLDMNRDERDRFMNKVFLEIAHELVGFSLLTSNSSPSSVIDELKLGFERIKHGSLSPLLRSATSEQIQTELGISPTGENLLTARESVSHQKLLEYGATDIGNGTLLNGDAFRIYHLPDNPYSDKANVAITLYGTSGEYSIVIEVDNEEVDDVLSAEQRVHSSDEHGVTLRLSDQRSITFTKSADRYDFPEDTSLHVDTYNGELINPSSEISSSPYLVSLIDNMPLVVGDLFSSGIKINAKGIYININPMGKCLIAPESDGFDSNEEFTILPFTLNAHNFYLLKQGERSWMLQHSLWLGMFDGVRLEEGSPIVFTRQDIDVLISDLPNYLLVEMRRVLSEYPTTRGFINFTNSFATPRYELFLDHSQEGSLDIAKTWSFTTDNLNWVL